MHPRILELNEKIKPIRQQIVSHPVYSLIDHPQKLAVFMQHHVFAVWDFMSLLKALQNKLTCTTIPWVPIGDAENRFLINEIVVGEESDVDEDGVRMSHFELYLKAMQQCEADATKIQSFIQQFLKENEIEKAFEDVKLPVSVGDFVRFTFEVIRENKPHILAAVFTFGREDLIPDMFMSMVNDLNQRWPDTISTFKYYLERHIEVDGDHHSHLAMKMVENLCANDDQRWAEAEKFVLESLQKRKALWDGVYHAITSNATHLADQESQS